MSEEIVIMCNRCGSVAAKKGQQSALEIEATKLGEEDATCYDLCPSCAIAFNFFMTNNDVKRNIGALPL